MKALTLLIAVNLLFPLGASHASAKVTAKPKNCVTASTAKEGASSVFTDTTAQTQATKKAPCVGPTGSDANADRVSLDPFEYKSSVVCERARDVGREVQDGTTGCYSAVLACAFRVPPSTTVLMNVYRRLKTAKASVPWEFVDTTCNPERYGVTAPPVAPTFGQIQTAFRSLPFGKPGVHIQPEGNVTLVNLATFYQVRWPAVGLAAGQDSAPITLLGWTIRFRIEAQDYTYRFGDGTSSEPTVDPGGVFPSGRIRHSYARAGSALVKVDARLTGKVSINGGPWEPIDTIVDLQGEPVTVVSVRTATNRLVR